MTSDSVFAWVQEYERMWECSRRADLNCKHRTWYGFVIYHLNAVSQWLVIKGWKSAKRKDSIWHNWWYNLHMFHIESHLPRWLPLVSLCFPAWVSKLVKNALQKWIWCWDSGFSSVGQLHTDIPQFNVWSWWTPVTLLEQNVMIHSVLQETFPPQLPWCCHSNQKHSSCPASPNCPSTHRWLEFYLIPWKNHTPTVPLCFPANFRLQQYH